LVLALEALAQHPVAREGWSARGRRVVPAASMR
jgi:hypothetical protein